MKKSERGAIRWKLRAIDYRDVGAKYGKSGFFNILLKDCRTLSKRGEELKQTTKGIIRIFAGFLVLLWALLAVVVMANRDWAIGILIGGLISGGLIVNGVELIRSK